jgi:4a-hydroxytetrahydrobiopterin dehydratase
MPRLLEPDEVTERLRELDGWQGDTHAIRRTYKAPDFPTAIRIVDEIAMAAEEMNHHPDIDIRWRTLHFSNATHAVGGVTRFDMELAGRIDRIAHAHGAT